MFKLLCLASTLAAATAFAPARGGAARSTSLNMARKSAATSLVGADVETNGFWDPLGLAENADALGRRRHVELKHGRVAMLAVLGNIVTDAGYHPLFDGKIPAGIGAIGKVPTFGWLQILLAIAAIELRYGGYDESKTPGDIAGFGSAFIPEDPAEYEKLQLRELKHGRLAMIAIMGELVQEVITGQTPLQQLLTGNINPFTPGAFSS